MAGDPGALQPFLERYLRLLFGFTLSYAPYGREQAFRITVASFVKTLRNRMRFGSPGEFQEELFRAALGECAATPPSGGPGPSLPSLKIVHEALIRLSPGDKALLLLRDQCHLPFERIAAILGTGLRDTRSSCLEARERLRARVKEVLEKPEANGHAM